MIAANRISARSEKGAIPMSHQRNARLRNALAQIWSVIEAIVGPGKTTGSPARGGTCSPPSPPGRATAEAGISVIRYLARLQDWGWLCAPRRSCAGGGLGQIGAH